MNRKEHWENVYSTKTDAEVSWTQGDPRLSLLLISEACPRGRVIDVGGGNSVLADRLLESGYSTTVLDISEAALLRARQRIGPRSSEIQWVATDVTAHPELGAFDLWHDRAVFHFLTDVADRIGYVELMRRTIHVGGHAIIATFAEDGPEKCSGLTICRYSARKLADELGSGFSLVKSVPEIHSTPWGKPQSFQYSVFCRR